MSEINEHVFEIRYKPNPKILDYRGTWAELISTHMALSQWNIVENRVDIYDKANKNHAFVGFRNSGFVTLDSPTKNYFFDQATKLFSFVAQLDGFEKQPFVERIGIRSKFCTSFEKDFDELKNRYSQRYLTLPKEAEKAIDAKLIDIGGPLNFADKLGNFNTMSGPMENKQIIQYFSNRKDTDVPEIGLFYDIDYWLKPAKTMDVSQINSSIRNFASAAWERYERIKQLILGD